MHVTGNLLKHYKERHLGCTLPESLAELDRVTMSVNNLSDAELQEDIQMSERTSENMEEDIKQEVRMCKILVCFLGNMVKFEAII